MTGSQAEVKLGLTANLGQFSLLVVVNAFVGAMVGMACGFAVELYVWLGTAIPWTWYVVIGTLATFGIGYIASLAFAAQEIR